MELIYKSLSCCVVHAYNASPRKLKQEDCCVYEVSLSYVILSQPGLCSKTLSQKTGKKKSLS